MSEIKLEVFGFVKKLNEICKFDLKTYAQIFDKSGELCKINALDCDRKQFNEFVSDKFSDFFFNYLDSLLNIIFQGFTG